MKNKIVLVLGIIISLSSCRPRYMRCPKRKRCLHIPNKTIDFKYDITPFYYTILAEKFYT